MLVSMHHSGISIVPSLVGHWESGWGCWGVGLGKGLLYQPGERGGMERSIAFHSLSLSMAASQPLHSNHPEEAMRHLGKGGGKECKAALHSIPPLSSVTMWTLQAVSHQRSQAAPTAKCICLSVAAGRGD